MAGYGMVEVVTATPSADMASPPSIHPDIAHLAFLLGTWRGSGKGDYPTIDRFEFTEETVFGHVGKPFLTFVQRTRDVDGAPLHTESGYLRPVGLNRAEFVISLPSGIVELLEGTVDADTGTVDLQSVQVARTATAKEVTSTARVYAVEGDILRWRFGMAAVGHGMAGHLVGELTRV